MRSCGGCGKLGASDPRRSSQSDLTAIPSAGLLLFRPGERRAPAKGLLTARTAAQFFEIPFRELQPQYRDERLREHPVLPRHAQLDGAATTPWHLVDRHHSARADEQPGLEPPYPQFQAGEVVDRNLDLANTGRQHAEEAVLQLELEGDPAAREPRDAVGLGQSLVDIRDEERKAWRLHTR